MTETVTGRPIPARNPPYPRQKGIAMTAMPAALVHARQEVIGRDDERWERLRSIIEARSLMRGDFTLTSGAKSTYLFQLRQTTMFPEG